MHSASELEKLQLVAESLKLFSRHDLSTVAPESPDVIANLYCDPKGGTTTLRQLLGPGMAFLVGRRGTGKSTLIDRAQFELRSSGNKLGCYVNVKALHDDAKEKLPLLPPELSDYSAVITSDVWQSYALKRELIAAILAEIIDQLKKRTADTIWQKAWRHFTSNTFESLHQKLLDIAESLQSPEFTDLTLLKEVAKDSTESSTNLNSKTKSSSALIDKKNVSVKLNARNVDSSTSKSDISEKFTNVLVRVFKIREKLSAIKSALQQFGIVELYLFLDDYSELSDDDAKFLTQALLSPLHQWDTFLKLKVAAYPGRIRYEDIDSTKVGHVRLDYADIYADQTDIGKKENAGADFIQRLMEMRFEHYLQKPVSEYFDTSSDQTMEVYYALLFDVSNGVPRILGWLLFYLIESRIAQHKAITPDSIKLAARRYYRDQVLPQLEIVRFSNIAFNSKLDKIAQFELLKELVKRSKECASNLRKGQYKQYKGLPNPPTSHLHFRVEYEKYIDFLEFNFFISKQRNAQAKTGLKSSVYALNYGLCAENSIFYGRPSGQAFRSYQVESFFNADNLIENYLNIHKKIVCSACNAEHPISKLGAISEYHMACPNCFTQASCKLFSFVPDADKILSVDAEERPEIEIGILHTISVANKPMYSVEIGSELDCSRQRAFGRGSKLAKDGILEQRKIDLGKGEREYFTLTERASKLYLKPFFKSEID